MSSSPSSCRGFRVPRRNRSGSPTGIFRSDSEEGRPSSRARGALEASAFLWRALRVADMKRRGTLLYAGSVFAKAMSSTMASSKVLWVCSIKEIHRAAGCQSKFEAAMRKVPHVVSPALAELVKAAADFNYRQRLIGTAIRHGNSPEVDVRAPLNRALQEMLESDQRLEASKEAVLAIGKMAQAMAGKNAKGTRETLQPELLQVLLRLPVGRADAAELSGPTGDLSTADDDVKRGLEEASITLSAKELRKREAELLYEVFVVYLRILRQRHLHGRELMGAVLTGLARWGQQVNVELLLEILSELRVVVKDAVTRSDEFVALHGSVLKMDAERKRGVTTE
eukprot:symbB.v1.2.016564.t2/scaffold1263.1/size128093/4